ncbi:MAG: response regulator receiver protein [Anaerocolumna sp.]|jgi:hypothetical protein|nr:response regulator receiver protein [Anaerocolumna sp.]
MFNRKVPLIIISVIVIIILTVGSDRLPKTYPKGEKGVLDLVTLDFERDITQIDGEWEFYWEQLLDPNDIDTGLITGNIVIPRSWNNYETKEGGISGNGYATYRITIVLAKSERLALKIPRIRSAYMLWVNGELIAKAGTVGKTRDTMVPQHLPQVAGFDAQKGNNEIIVQVSNFYHRSGGMLESIKLGSDKQILELKYRNIALNILLFSSLITMGVYHLALYFFRKKNIAALYFGSFCMLIGIRTLLVGECFIFNLFPDFSWEIAHKILTLTYHFGVPLVLMFFLSIYPKYFHLNMIKLAQLFGMVFSALTLLTPARIFTVANPVYQIWSFIVIVYILWVLIRIYSNKEKDSWLIIIGALALLLTTINDIAFVSTWLNDREHTFLRIFIRTGNLISIGQLIFAFTNSLLLAKKFSSSLEHVETVTAELMVLNSYLDKLVLQRTKALMDSNKRIEKQNIELERINQNLRTSSSKNSLEDIDTINK